MEESPQQLPQPSSSAKEAIERDQPGYKYEMPVEEDKKNEGNHSLKGKRLFKFIDEFVFEKCPSFWKRATTSCAD